MTLQNSTFYNTDGTFRDETAKQAYFRMMKDFSYPIPKALEDGIWAIDFGLDDFVNVGMAGIFWWNDEQYGYFGHEIFLLPGQMIVEHAHVATEETTPKMEAWHVRHGMVYLFGEGEPTEPLPVRVPESQADFVTVRNCNPLQAGEVSGLNRQTAPHFMLAGPGGAIVTEYATYHDNDGLRFTNPQVQF